MFELITMDEAGSDNSKAGMVEAWAKGWAMARGVSAPVRDHGAFRIDPGWPDQVRRYVFAELNEGFKTLCREIHDPWVFLKICAAPERVKAWLPEPWVIESPRFMMICAKPMHPLRPLLPGGYRLEIEKCPAVSVIRIMQNEELASIGRVVVVDGYAIYDRIETIAEHRRLGLATRVMTELEAIALEQGGTKGVLVATAEGKNLYETLGWEVYCDYTTAVIRGQAGHC